MCKGCFYAVAACYESRAVWPDLAKFCHFGNKKITPWQFLEGLFSLWQYFEPNLANFYASGQIFICLKWPNIEKWSSQLVALVALVSSLEHKLRAFLLWLFSCYYLNANGRHGRSNFEKIFHLQLTSSKVTFTRRQISGKAETRNEWYNTKCSLDQVWNRANVAASNKYFVNETVQSKLEPMRFCLY